MNVWPQESSKSDVRAKKVVIILRSKDYVLNKKLKSPIKTARWPNLNGFAVGWSKFFDFGVQWPKPNLAYSWMVKNEVFSNK
jgi:hypothetical protein